MSENFAGNPYEGTLTSPDDPGGEIAAAIRLLAFEVRTANLIAAAIPVDQTPLTPEQLDRSEHALAEARERLGRKPKSNVDGYLQSQAWRDR